MLIRFYSSGSSQILVLWPVYIYPFSFWVKHSLQGILYRIVRIWVGEEICRLLVKALSRSTEHKVKGQCGLFFLNSRKYSFLINQFLMMYCAFKYRNGWWSCFLRFSPLALFVKTSRKRMSPSSQISLFSINASHVTLH